MGGPAQKTFSGLVGLELRPRRLKDAANLWAALESAGGMEFRDAPWEHPDIAPTGADLDDPLGYVEKRKAAGSGDDVDSALDALLRGDGSDGGDAGTGPQATRRPDDRRTPRGRPGRRPVLHADAVRVLAAYQPGDRQQELTRLDLLAHLAAHPDARLEVGAAGPPHRVVPRARRRRSSTCC